MAMKKSQPFEVITLLVGFFGTPLLNYAISYALLGAVFYNYYLLEIGW